MTLFGSTNLAARSAERDVELGFVLVLPEKESECSALRQSLADEVQNLRKYGQEWKGAEGIKGERKVRFGTKLLAWLVGGML
jgi:CDP-diacylglycerol--glycerol-3-phosphate 3-phosphatidyltransferase